MSLKVGDKIVFMNESGGGIIKSINHIGKYIVEDENGFDKSYFTNEIAQVFNEDYKIDESNVNHNKDEASISAKTVIVKSERTGSRKQIDIWEIDLHIEELVESHRNLSNFEIMKIQMGELKSILNNARAKRVRKLVIIHGVGEGVLKSEVRSFLHEQTGLNFYDADFREYGKGATAVELFYF